MQESEMTVRVRVRYGAIEECDCCHDELPLSEIIFTGVQFLCAACYQTEIPAE